MDQLFKEVTKMVKDEYKYEGSYLNIYDFEGVEAKGDKRIKQIADKLKSINSFASFHESKEMSSELAKYSYIVAGELVKEELKVTQLRRFYNYVKKMQYEIDGDTNKVLARLTMLPPKLAGASSKKDAVKPLYVIIAACIENKKIEDKEDFICFVEFFEAILSYFEAISKDKCDEKTKT